MARWTYAFSNGMFNDFHREWEGLAAIDGDLFEVCPKCYEPLALLETCYDKGQKYKATTFTEIVASRLKIPCTGEMSKVLCGSDTSVSVHLRA